MACGKIHGKYDDYLEMLKAKHSRLGRELDGDIIVLDSYDGAEHRWTLKKKTSIISFSSQLFTPAIVNSGLSAAESVNILTWQQMIGDEKVCNLFPALEEIYERKKVLRKENPNVFFYKLHDGKMHYLLNQHSLYSRKNYPFLMCNCKRGQGVKDGEHQCTMIMDDEYEETMKRSKRRWDRKRS